MPKAKVKSKRIRPRPGYVMVEMDEAHRSKLERLKEAREIAIGESTSLAAAVRALIREGYDRLENIPEKPLNGS